VTLVWVNSPANPTGRVLPPAHLRKMVDWARERGAVIAADECYLDLGWDAEPVSILHPEVCGESASGVLAVHSLSKRSNMAGYRAGSAAGDPALVAELLEIRRHAGMMMPAPIQAAMAAALDDDAHAAAQRARYATRRERLRAALAAAGWVTEDSQAGVFLWVGPPGPGVWGRGALRGEARHLGAPRAFYRAAGPGGGPGAPTA